MRARIGTPGQGGTLRFTSSKILGPPLFESSDTQTSSTLDQIFRLASVEVTVLRTRNGNCAGRFTVVGGDMCDRDIKQLGEHEAEFVLSIRLWGGIMEDRRNQVRTDRRCVYDGWRGDRN